MLILEALNYSDDGEDGSKDYFVASKGVLGDGSSKLMIGEIISLSIFSDYYPESTEA